VLLATVDIADGHPRFVVFRSDMLGQVIRRDEKDQNVTTGDPHEVWLRYNGRQMGYVGNNGNANVDYASSIAQKQAGVAPGSFADFDLERVTHILDPAIGHFLQIDERGGAHLFL